MASETVTLTTICGSGGHLTFTLAGARAATVNMMVDELTSPVSDEDIVAFCKVISKLARIGRTAAQARALLQSGVTVTV